MGLDDVAAIARNAVAVYGAAIERGVPPSQAEEAAVAHCMMHWPATQTETIHPPPPCTTPECGNLSYAVLVNNDGASAVCIDCMLDLTENRPDIEVTTLTGDRIDLDQTG